MPDHTPYPAEAPPAAAETAPATARAPRRGRRVRGALLGAALVLAAVAGAVAVWRPDLAVSLRGGPLPGPVSPPAAPAPAAPPPALTVAVAPAALRPLARPVLGDGSVVAWQELVIGTEATGLKVLEVAVEEGDAVRAGQLLVRLDESVPRAQRDQAAAAVKEAEAALRVAEQDLARTTQLARSEAAAQQLLDQRRAAQLQAEARLVAARGKLAEAEARLAQARIAAPTDGVVSRRSALVGAVVAPGQEMARLIRDGRLEVAARIPELELHRVRPGQAVRVTHGDRAVEARVRLVAATVAAETRLGTVYVALPPGAGLRPGMFARAEVATGEAPALLVPQTALVVREDRPAVFVLPEGTDRVALRPVATGARREGMVEVTDGLRAGEPVVVVGGGFLTDGDRVRLAPAAEGR